MPSAAQQYDAAIEREFKLEASPFDPFAERRKIRTAGIAAIEAAIAEERERCADIVRKRRLDEHATTMLQEIENGT